MPHHDHTRLDGQVAVVTGSSSGIGRAIAAALARAGAQLVVNSREPGRARAAAEALSAGGASAVGVAADVGLPDGGRTLVDAALEHFGRVDVLVNNAGIPLARPTESITAEQWDAVLATNLSGPFHCARAVAPVMFRQGGGTIVNISSIFGSVAAPGRAAYVAAKHGLEGLTKALAVEWADRGVRVLSVAPAYVGTRLVEETMSTGGFTRADIERRTPLGRLGTPEEVGGVVAFLASPAAAYLTGSTVAVDGGWLAHGGW